MNEIDKLLEERGKIHGDAKTTHEIAMSLWNHAVGTEGECDFDS